MGMHHGATEPTGHQPAGRGPADRQQADRQPGRRSRALTGLAGVALVAPLGFAVLGGLLSTPSAAAQGNQVTGRAVCSADGTYSVTWTATNDHPLAETPVVTSATGSAPTFAPATLAPATGAAGTTATATQTLPGTDTGASLTLRADWSDGTSQTQLGTLSLPGTCTTATLVTTTGATTGTPETTSPASPGTPTPTASTSPTGAPARTKPGKPAKPTASGTPTGTCPTTGPLTDISYLVDGVPRTTLAGTTQSGDTIVARFTVAAGCDPTTLSLISYDAPSGSYDPTTVDQDVYVGADTGTFAPGAHSLTITVPSCFYQVDFVYGTPVKVLTSDYYHLTNRWIDGNNGGSTACVTTPTTTPPTTPTTAPPTTPTTAPPTTPTNPPVTTTPPVAVTTTHVAPTHVAPTASTTPSVAVLGETFTAPPAAAASLPFTGSPTALLLEIAGALLGGGLLLRALGGWRRTRS